MIDLKFNFTLPCGGRVTKKYSTIMDFTDAVDEGDYPKENLSCGPVDATFFENTLLDKQFATVQDLYNHCSAIMRGHK